jgi:nucleoside 2-deoxyribosyltransferase
MKIYLGYRYTGADKTKLKSFISAVAATLENQGHQTFIYFRDGGNWEAREGHIPLKQVIEDSFVQIKQSDAALFLLQSNEFSEGMLLDIGCAIACGIPLYLAKQVGTALPKTEALATQIFEYTDEAGLLAKLKI